MNIHRMLNMPLPAVAEVSSLEALRAVSDSQRHRILSLLIRQALTPSQIATKLKIARTRVYYHLDLLREHGFIRVVGERPVAAMIERTYRACAQRFHVDRRMLAAGGPVSAVNDVQAQLLERAADDLRASPEGGDGGGSACEVLVSRSFLRLSPRRARDLRAALQSLVEEYAESDAQGGAYELAFALFSTQGESS